MLDYDTLEAQAIQDNLLDLRRKLDRGTIDARLRARIESVAARFGIEPELLRHKVLTDDLFGLFFIKEPGRQSFHQHRAFEYLSVMSGVQDAKQLPSRGPGSKYVASGVVLTHEQYKDTAGETKSIDFEWRIQRPDGSPVVCYATHKFTKDAGGSQDNQFKDVQGFLAASKLCLSRNTFFFAICDGRYYESPYHDHPTRIDYLNAACGSQRSKAVTINTLEAEFPHI